MIPLITVIVPAYNQEKYIGRCIRSLLSQKIKKNLFEIIIIDDKNDNYFIKVIDVYKKKFNCN